MNQFDEAHSAAMRLAEGVVPFNIDFLDDISRGIYPTDVVLVSAKTGAGKTHIATVMAESSARQGRRVGFFALEAHRTEIEQRMLYREMIAICREIHDKPPAWGYSAYIYDPLPWTPLATEAARRLTGALQGRLRTHYGGSEFSPQDIHRHFQALRDQVDLIILDHLHFLNLDSGKENSQMKHALKAIRDSALEMEVPIIVVAHLRKSDGRSKALLPSIDDIHGSSDISKIATKAVVLAPGHTLNRTEPWLAPTLMQVTKDRIGGTQSFAARVEFNMRTQCYEPGYKVVKLKDANTELVPVKESNLPTWARRGSGYLGMEQHRVEYRNEL